MYSPSWYESERCSRNKFRQWCPAQVLCCQHATANKKAGTFYPGFSPHQLAIQIGPGMFQENLMNVFVFFLISLKVSEVQKVSEKRGMDP